MLAFIGQRITGIKAFALEISLNDVAVRVQDGDFTGAVMAMAETEPSASPELLDSFKSAMQGRSKVLRVNLRDDDYWSTRVFLVAALAEDYTEVEVIVFVRSGAEHIFVGLAAPRAVRARLAARFPACETAYREVRSAALTNATADQAREIDEILMWRWPSALRPSESDIKVIVGSEELRQWLKGDLDSESLAYGPLTPLLRYRIISRAQRYAALTDGPRFVAIVDRDELARRSTSIELERTFG